MTCQNPSQTEWKILLAGLQGSALTLLGPTIGLGVNDVYSREKTISTLVSVGLIQPGRNILTDLLRLDYETNRFLYFDCQNFSPNIVNTIFFYIFFFTVMSERSSLKVLNSGGFPKIGHELAKCVEIWRRRH